MRSITAATGRLPTMSTVVDVRDRLAPGSGPSAVPARILEALARPTIGHP
jgi:hypothetical protein